MSHPIPAVWSCYSPISTFDRYGGGCGVSTVLCQHQVCTARGPGIRERRHERLWGDREAPTWARAQAYLVMRGIERDQIQLIDGPPPCIFCKKYRHEHIEGFFGEHCRPTCHVPGCGKNTCVQALVGGFLPACLDHAFIEGRWVRRDYIFAAIVEPHPLQWRVEAELARQIARAA